MRTHLFTFLFCLYLLPVTSAQQSDTLLLNQLLQQADSATTHKEYNNALDLYKKALKLCKQKTDDLKIADIQHGIGLVYFAKNDYNTAKPQFEKAAEGRTKELGSNHLKVAESYFRLGQSYIQLGVQDSAIVVLEKTLAIRKKLLGPSHTDVLAVYYFIGESLYESGKRDEAMKIAKEGLALYESSADKDEYRKGEFCNLIGSCYWSTGAYKKAETYMTLALESAIKAKGYQHMSVARNYNMLGFLQFERGAYFEAIRYLEKAVSTTIAVEGENHPAIASIYRNLGNTYSVVDDHDKALYYSLKSLEITKALFGENHNRVAHSYANVGTSYLGMQDWEKARISYEKAIAMGEKLLSENHFWLYSWNGDLGLCLFNMDRYEDAIFTLEKALNIARQSLGPKHKDVAMLYKSLAEVYVEQGNLTAAMNQVDFALNALNIGETSEEDYQVYLAESQFHILEIKARIFLKQFKITKDSQNLYQAKKSYSKIIDLREFIKNQMQEPASRTALIARTFRAFESAMETDWLLQKVEGKARVENILTLAEKNKDLFLSESLRISGGISFTGIPDSLLEQERQLKTRIATLEQEHFSGSIEKTISSNTLTDQLHLLKDSLQNLLQFFEMYFPNYYQLKYANTAIDISRVQENLLQEEQALLEYFVGESNLFVIVLLKDTLLVHVQKKDFPLEEWVLQLQQSITTYSQTLGSPDAKKNASLYLTKSWQLYQKLLQPIEDILPQKLLIVPDGILSYLPFEVLLTTAPDTTAVEINWKKLPYLLQRHQLSYWSSVTLASQSQSSSQKIKAGNLLAFAPDFSEGMNRKHNNSIAKSDTVRNNLLPLPGAEKEAAAIRQISGGQLFAGSKATESIFKFLAPDYNTLHLATHTLLDNRNPNYSKLVFSTTEDSLSDGYLHSYELYNLSLNADLVTLSACNTGVGQLRRGEGISSLARGFHYAGCPNLVMSLWAVNDLAAPELMTRFYQNVSIEMTKNESLHFAKLDYIEEASNLAAHPYFWGSFVYIGDQKPHHFNKGMYIRWPLWLGILAISFLLLSLIKKFFKKK